MRLATRMLLAPLVAVALSAAAAAAQGESATLVFAFAPAAEADETKKVEFDGNQPKAPAGWKDKILEVRPNHDRGFALYARGPQAGDLDKEYVIELRATATGRPIAQKKMPLNGQRWTRVRFDPPALAAPAPAAAPAPGAAPAPAPEPLPPGVLLPAGADAGTFVLRLLDEKGQAAVRDAENREYGRQVDVKVLSPDAYVQVTEPVVSRAGNAVTVEVTVKPQADGDKPRYAGTATATLGFLPQPGSVVRTGLYRRTLGTDPANPLAAAKLTGSIETPAARARFSVGVDGVDRAFVFEPQFKTAGEVEKETLKQDTARAVRVYPAAGFKTADASLPVPAYAVRVDADNAQPGDKLELWVRPAGSRDDAAREVIRLGGPRDEKVWLDPAGKDAAVVLASRSRDWTYSLDLLPLRGTLEVVAAVRPAAGTPVESAPLLLTVDATPPKSGGIKVADLGPRNELPKGRPLVVTATAAEDATAVKRAVFFIGQLTDDRKIPADAVKADGVFVDGVWAARLPVPAVPPGGQAELTVSVVFFNEVGLAADDRTTVILVDAGAGGAAVVPTGTLTGTVRIGDTVQPDVAVILRTPDGKEVAATRTLKEDKVDPKTQKVVAKAGTFRFENVPVGPYIVSSAKQSSSYPFVGAAPVQVTADKDGKPTTKPVTVSMIKNVR